MEIFFVFVGNVANQKTKKTLRGAWIDYSLTENGKRVFLRPFHYKAVSFILILINYCKNNFKTQWIVFYG